MTRWRSSCLVSLLLGVLVSACTAPTHPASLPMVDPPAPQVLRYRWVPDAPELRPPVEALGLLATSPEHPRWAVSDGRRLWIAGGDGPPVERRRDHGTRLRSLAMDDAGGLWLLDEHDRLTRITSDGSIERPSPLPVERTDAIVIGAGRIVVLGMVPDGAEPPPREPGDVELDEEFVLAISDDAGRTWRLRRRPFNQSEHDELRISPDGTMQLMDGEELSCGGGWQARWISHVDRRGWTQLDWPLDTRADRYAGSGGWSYGFAEGFRAVGRGGADYLLHPVETRFAFVHDGRAGVLLADGGMWAVAGRRLTRIGDLAPPLRDAWFDALAIAHDGAVMVTVDRSIFVGSAQGWRTVELDNHE